MLCKCVFLYHSVCCLKLVHKFNFQIQGTPAVRWELSFQTGSNQIQILVSENPNFDVSKSGEQSRNRATRSDLSAAQQIYMAYVKVAHSWLSDLRDTIWGDEERERSRGVASRRQVGK
jgi:hypothetical protein